VSNVKDLGITSSRSAGLAVAVAIASFASPARARETIRRNLGAATNPFHGTSFDATGRAALSGTVPPSLSACTIDFQAITFDSTGALLFSGVETLTIQ